MQEADEVVNSIELLVDKAEKFDGFVEEIQNVIDDRHNDNDLDNDIDVADDNDD